MTTVQAPAPSWTPSAEWTLADNLGRMTDQWLWERFREQIEGELKTFNGCSTYRGNGTLGLAQLLRKRFYASGSHRIETTWSSIVCEFYGDLDPTDKVAVKGRSRSTRTKMGELKLWGVIDYGVRTVGTGKSVGIWIELQDVRCIVEGWVAQLVRAHDS